MILQIGGGCVIFYPPKPWGEDDQRLNYLQKEEGPQTAHDFNGWRKMLISHHPPFQKQHGLMENGW